jgi:acyl-CoA synthetase (AMP-forming)/AMP-acid ligase II
MVGFLGRERHEAFDADGWYHTGDLGYLDDDSWLYFKGRLGEMIKTPGGTNVTPSEVEAALMADPGVLEAFVTGIAAPEGGQYVGAAVIARPGHELDPDRLRGTLRTRLSAYKLPRYLWVCAKADLPFLESGKIDKTELGSHLAQQVIGRSRGGSP